MEMIIFWKGYYVTKKLKKQTGSILSAKIQQRILWKYLKKQL